MKLIYAGVAVLLATAGCAGSDKPADPALVLHEARLGRARTFASITNSISKNPAAADSILAAVGQTRESLENAVCEIAGDSVMSVAYVAAKGP